MPTITLEKDWINQYGVLKRAGTEITFSHDSKELAQILGAFGNENIDLPEDLPARKQLLEAGYTSVQSLASIEDLTAIKGIGVKLAEELNNYFNLNEED